MNRSLRNLRLLVRAQSTLVEEQVGRAGRQAALMVIAGVAALFGMAMLDVAGFLALQPKLGPGWAALAVAGSNFLLAAILAFVALRMAETPETGQAREARDLALADLESTLQGMGAEAADLKQALTAPMAGLKASVVTAVVSSLGRRLRRRRRKKPSAEA